MFIYPNDWLLSNLCVSFTCFRFIDVLHTIKEHAFAVSEFPLILSIENHCTLPQQRKMANQFQEVFKDMLLTQPIERDSREMPSPQQLRRKIIIKVSEILCGGLQAPVKFGLYWPSLEYILVSLDVLYCTFGSWQVANGISRPATALI